MSINLRITPWQTTLVYENYERERTTGAHTLVQHDWHCMAYAIFLLQQYHNGEL